ncbi:hypothetical protein [Caulobacter segnis]
MPGSGGDTMMGKAAKALGLGVFYLVAAFFALKGILGALGCAEYLRYMLVDGTIVDMWAVLSAITVACAIVALIMAGLCLRRRKLMAMALWLALPAIPSTVLEASRCDYMPLCNVIGWAALPAPAFAWQVRVRDVTEGEVAFIASQTLHNAGSEAWAFEPKLANRQWRLIAQKDGVRQPYDVVIDARTGQGRLEKR